MHTEVKQDPLFSSFTPSLCRISLFWDWFVCAYSTESEGASVCRHFFPALQARSVYETDCGLPRTRNSLWCSCNKNGRAPNTAGCSWSVMWNKARKERSTSVLGINQHMVAGRAGGMEQGGGRSE
eukprot:1158067-Pelagomonas_calceolata.AAC.8